MTLSGIRSNNIFLSCIGINFVNPVFRLFSGQFPYDDLESYTIYSHDNKRKEKSFKKLLDKNENPFLVIIRGHNSVLEQVLFVPPKEQRQGSIQPALMSAHFTALVK
jgi:hypothetical protein